MGTIKIDILPAVMVTMHHTCFNSYNKDTDHIRYEETGPNELRLVVTSESETRALSACTWLRTWLMAYKVPFKSKYMNVYLVTDRDKFVFAVLNRPEKALHISLPENDSWKYNRIKLTDI